MRTSKLGIVALVGLSLSFIHGCALGSGEEDPADGLTNDLRRSSTVRLSGSFRLNGAPFPAAYYETGSIFLEPIAGGEPTPLGRTNDQSYAVQVPVGDYFVVYSHEAGTEVPQNPSAKLERLRVRRNTRHDIDVDALTVSGNITINGAAPPGSFYDFGHIVLERNGEPGFVAGDTRDGSYSALVIPGSYEAFYENVASNGSVPINGQALLDSTSLLGDPEVWDLDIPMVQADWSAVLNGAPFPGGFYDYGEILLRDVTTDDAVVLGNTATGPFQVMLVPGLYDALYRHVTGDEVPLNDLTTVDTSVDVDFPNPADPTVPLDLVIAIEAVSLSGSYYHDGVLFPASFYQYGTMSLLDSLDRPIELGSTIAQSYAGVLVLPGTYDVLYERVAGGAEVPANGEHIVSEGVDFLTSQTHDVSIDTFQSQGNLSYLGVAPPGAFWARRTEGGVACRRCSLFELAPAGSTSYDAALVPGTYDVIYSTDADPAVVEAEGYVVQTGWVVDADQTKHFLAGFNL